MKILRCFLALVQICVLAIILSGVAGDCNTNFDGSSKESPSTRARFVEADPPPGGDLSANGIVTVTFDEDPGITESSVGTVDGTGKTRRITGPFEEGELILLISWTNGGPDIGIFYTVVPTDTELPTVTGGTVSDGDENVDYEEINGDKVIEVTFSEDVSGNIALETEDGDDVGWIGKVKGMKGTLELVAGKELGSQTTYVIKCKVADGAGNELEVSISFTTKDKA